MSHYRDWEQEYDSYEDDKGRRFLMALYVFFFFGRLEVLGFDNVGMKIIGLIGDHTIDRLW